MCIAFMLNLYEFYFVCFFHFDAQMFICFSKQEMTQIIGLHLWLALLLTYVVSSLCYLSPCLCDFLCCQASLMPLSFFPHPLMLGNILGTLLHDISVPLLFHLTVLRCLQKLSPEACEKSWVSQTNHSISLLLLHLPLCALLHHILLFTHTNTALQVFVYVAQLQYISVTVSNGRGCICGLSQC